MKDYSKLINENPDYYARLSTVPIHLLSEENRLKETASSCIIEYQNEHILLAAEHSVIDEPTMLQKKCGILIGIDPNERKTEYYIPSIHFLKSHTLSEKELESDPNETLPKIINERSIFVDFAYSFLPKHVAPRDEFIDYENNLVYFTEKNIIKTNLEIDPNKEDKYNFFGRTKTEINDKERTFSFQEQKQKNIKFLKVKENDEFYVFEMPNVIKTKEEFQGCSGSPIFNERGELVSLFVKQFTNTNRILGINLKKFKVAIDIDINIRSKTNGV
jgi:hypothetical protein